MRVRVRIRIRIRVRIRISARIRVRVRVTSMLCLLSSPALMLVLELLSGVARLM